MSYKNMSASITFCKYPPFLGVELANEKNKYLIVLKKNEKDDKPLMMEKSGYYVVMGIDKEGRTGPQVCYIYDSMVKNNEAQKKLLESLVKKKIKIVSIKETSPESDDVIVTVE